MLEAGMFGVRVYMCICIYIYRYIYIYIYKRNLFKLSTRVRACARGQEMCTKKLSRMQENHMHTHANTHANTHNNPRTPNIPASSIFNKKDLHQANPYSPSSPFHSLRPPPPPPPSLPPHSELLRSPQQNSIHTHKNRESEREREIHTIHTHRRIQ